MHTHTINTTHNPQPFSTKPLCCLCCFLCLTDVGQQFSRLMKSNKKSVRNLVGALKEETAIKRGDAHLVLFITRGNGEKDNRLAKNSY